MDSSSPSMVPFIGLEERGHDLSFSQIDRAYFFLSVQQTWKQKHGRI
jgi:hypothetical protein